MNKLKIFILVICCWFSALCLKSQCADNRVDILEKVGLEQKKIFCCEEFVPYRPRRTDHEDLFNSFKDFASGNGEIHSLKEDTRSIQVIIQQNFGPILEKRYFVLPDFQEVKEDFFIEYDYKRLNSFKNYKCAKHNLFFELNAYTRSSSARSNHHQSTTSGNVYSRDSKIIDFESVSNKGIL